MVGQELGQTAEGARHLAAVDDDVVDGARQQEDDGEGGYEGTARLPEEHGQHQQHSAPDLGGGKRMGSVG